MPSEILAPYPPDLLRVHEVQGSTGSTSLTSGCSSGFDDLSRVSSTTDVSRHSASFDSLFDSPSERPRFEDPIWNGLSDQQWQRYTDAKDRDAVQSAQESILRPLDLDWKDDGIEGEVDTSPIEALEGRLRDNRTVKSKRALKIMENRGQLNQESTQKFREVQFFEENVEDHAEDFGPGSVEQLEDWPSKVDDKEWLIDAALDVLNPKDSTFDGITQTCASGPDLDFSFFLQQSAFDLSEQFEASSLYQYHDPADFPMPPKPIIQARDAQWECPSFSLGSDLSSLDSISQVIMSPLLLDGPATDFNTSPGIQLPSHRDCHSSLGSPIPSVSSLMFRSRRPFPTSLLDQSLDLAAVMHLEIASSLRNVNTELIQEPNPTQPLVGLGFDLSIAADVSPQIPLTPPTSPSSSQLLNASFSPLCIQGLVRSISSRALSLKRDTYSVTHQAVPADVPTANSSLLEAGSEDAPYSAGSSPSHCGMRTDEFYELKRTTLDVIAEESEGYTTSNSVNGSQILVGLGLGEQAESILQSSSSISHLQDISDACVEVPFDQDVAPPQCASEILWEPSIALSRVGQLVHDEPLVLPSEMLYGTVLDSSGSMSANISESKVRHYVPKAPTFSPKSLANLRCVDLEGSEYGGSEYNNTSLDTNRSCQSFLPTVTSGSEHAFLLSAPIDCGLEVGSPSAQWLIQIERSISVEVIPSTSLRSISSAKSAEGLGLGLPSDFGHHPPRQMVSCSQASSNSGSKKLSTAEECYDLSKLAAALSPSSPVDTSRPKTSSRMTGSGLRPFAKLRRFAKRKLCDIPELSSPSPTTTSPRRAFSPLNGGSSPRWTNFPVFSRQRSPQANADNPRFRFFSPRAAISGQDPPSTMSPRNVDFCPQLEELRPTSSSSSPRPEPTAATWSRFTEIMSRLSLSSGSSSNSCPKGTSREFTSPGVVEHSEVPRGLGVLRHILSPAAPSSGVANMKSKPTRSLRLLF